MLMANMKNFFMFQIINIENKIKQTLTMQGSQVFKIAVNTLDKIVDEALDSE